MYNVSRTIFVEQKASEDGNRGNGCKGAKIERTDKSTQCPRFNLS